MESSIEFKGLVFAYDEGIGSSQQGIYAIQGQTNKLSYSTFTKSEYVTNFVITQQILYAITSHGRLIKLVRINSGSGTDDWEVVGQNDIKSANFGVVYQDSIYMFTATKYLAYDGETWSSTTTALSTGADKLYFGVTYQDKIYLYGAKAGANKVFSYYDGGLTEEFSLAPAALIPFETYYRPNGKSLIIENKGKLFFPMSHSTNDVISYDIDDKTYEVLETSAIGLYIQTSLVINDDVLLVATYTIAADTSNVLSYPLVRFRHEYVLPSGDGEFSDKLWRIESDPIFPSPDSKEELVYSPQYMCLAQLKGQKSSLVKYGSRREFYCDLNNANSLIGVSLKDVVDDLSNLMNSYFAFRPENILEIGLDDTVGKSNAEYTLTDDGTQKDVRIREVLSSEKADNNFKRVVIGWSDAKANGEEYMGVISTVGTEEFSYSSILINDPNTAKNIATYLFSKMSDSDMYQLRTDWAPFLRDNDNVIIDTIKKFLYLNSEDEYKIVEVNNNFNGKYTEIRIIKRNINLETFI